MTFINHCYSMQKIIMWHSEEDFIKDIASLNDFGTPGDKEPYQVLYSKGRGTILHQESKPTNSFIDHRTGERIHVSDKALDLNDVFYQKSKGRGRKVGNLSHTERLLQKQLRLARPLGSGDEAIESYFKRNRPLESDLTTEEKNLLMLPKNSNPQTSSFNKNLNIDLTCCSKEKSQQRIIGTRSSKLQNNILMAGLLSKNKVIFESDAEVKENKASANLMTLDKCNENKTELETDEKESVIDSKDKLIHKCDSEHFCESLLDISYEQKQIKSTNDLKSEEYTNHQSSKKCTSSDDEQNEISSWIETFGKKTIRKDSFDVSNFLNNGSKNAISSSNEFSICNDRPKEDFVLNEKDFPPI